MNDPSQQHYMLPKIIRSVLRIVVFTLCCIALAVAMTLFLKPHTYDAIMEEFPQYLTLSPIRPSISMLKSTVVVYNVEETKKKNVYAIEEGSGVVIQRMPNDNYLILTARHVAIGSNTIIMFSDDSYVNVEKVVLGQGQNDVAFLLVHSKKMRSVATMAKSSNEHGDLCILGNPMGTKWHCSPARRTFNYDNTHGIEVWCKGCDRGDSGGGVFNEKHELIGEFFSIAVFPWQKSTLQYELENGEYNNNLMHFGYFVPVETINKMLTYPIQFTKQHLLPKDSRIL